MDDTTRQQIAAVRDGFHMIEDNLRALDAYLVKKLTQKELAELRKMKRNLMVAHAIAAELGESLVPADGEVGILGSGT
jgi:transcription termination factor NusB